MRNEDPSEGLPPVEGAIGIDVSAAEVDLKVMLRKWLAAAPDLPPERCGRPCDPSGDVMCIFCRARLP